MRHLLLGVLIPPLAFVHGAHAQSMNAADAPCRGVVVTSELTRCLDLARGKADARLNETYGQMLDVLTPGERKDLVQAQRLWIKYRDAACDAEYKLFEGGTAGTPARLACLEAETRAREASLLRWYGWRIAKFGK